MKLVTLVMNDSADRVTESGSASKMLRNSMMSKTTHGFSQSLLPSSTMTMSHTNMRTNTRGGLSPHAPTSPTNR